MELLSKLLLDFSSNLWVELTSTSNHFNYISVHFNSESIDFGVVALECLEEELFDLGIIFGKKATLALEKHVDFLHSESKSGDFSNVLFFSDDFHMPLNVDDEN